MLLMIIKNMDKKNYGIYGASMALFSAIVFIISSLISINGIVDLGGDTETVKLVFAFYYAVIGITGLMFIVYALNFYIKSRMNDYAMFIVLGTSREKMILFLIVEYAVIFMAATIAGLLLGMIVIGIISIVFAFHGIEVILSIYEILKNIKTAVYVSMLIFSFGCITGVCRFFRKDISRIMTAGVKKEYKYKWLCVLASIGLVLLYASIKLLSNPTFEFVLLSLVGNIIGIYLILTYGLSVVIGVIHIFFNRIYLKHLLTINHLVYKYKTNKTIIFLTYVLNIVVVFFSGGMIITTYLDAGVSNSMTIIRISSYFMAAFTLICNMGILSIKQLNELSENCKRSEILNFLGMDCTDRKKTAVAEFKILMIISGILSNLLVWFYIIAECRRVGLFDRQHIMSFVLFQMVLILIQVIYYETVKRYITVRTEGRKKNGYFKGKQCFQNI